MKNTLIALGIIGVILVGIALFLAYGNTWYPDKPDPEINKMAQPVLYNTDNPPKDIQSPYNSTQGEK